MRPAAMPRPRPVALEVCVDTIEGLRACIGRADRVELCAALSVGGLTPGPGLIAAARDCPVPVHAMIRPVAGGFDYGEDLVAACESEVRSIREAGLAGVVIGVTRDGALDPAALARLVAAAGPLEVTLHRAVDLLDDAEAAVEIATDLGISRILTSGGAAQAVDGLPRIAAMVRASRDRVEIMAGSGITAENAWRVLDETGVHALHASCAGPRPPDARAASLGFEASAPKVTDPARIDALRAVLKGKA